MTDALVRRRAFLAGLGLVTTGLWLGVSDEAAALGPPGPPDTKATDAGLAPNVFVHVATSGAVTIVCHRSEMGQGVKSSLPVLIADEMGADMARVTVVQADGDAAYGDQNTDGSSSVRSIYEKMRRVGAVARVMLVLAAAKRFGVSPSACTAEGNYVVHAPSKRRLEFGALAAAAAKLPIPKLEDVALRPRSELRHVGGPLPLLDGPAIVTGSAVFGADVALPGMLVAVIARPPDVGGTVEHYDPSRALAIPGVRRVVKLPAPTAPYAFQALGGVAVLADTTWAAMRGRAALEMRWSTGENASYDSTSYDAELAAAVKAPGKVVRSAGDASAALASAKKKLVADYAVPHLAHAPMEPPVALARVLGDTCEVWTSTQNPQAAKKEAARALGIDESKVTVHVTLLGGGFGRKSKADFVSEAVLLSRAAGAPVRVQWTREDDIRHDYFHTVSAQHLEAGLDDAGRVTAWLHRTAFPSISSTFARGVVRASEMELQQGILDLPLAVPHVRAEVCDAVARTRVGWLRSVCNIQHAFAVGSFADEIAEATGRDPSDVLLDLYGPPRTVTPEELGVAKVPNYGAPLTAHPIDTARMRHVIERVVEISRFKSRKADGRAMGIAAHRSFLTYVATVVWVTNDAQGKVRVEEAWVVVDAGTVVNPDRARAQMEGSVVFGSSLALYGAITMRGGAVTQSNFHDYKLVRAPSAPRRIEVEIVPSEGAPGGIGEPGVPPVAPAIANAVRVLKGTRVRTLPLARAGFA